MKPFQRSLAALAVVVVVVLTLTPLAAQEQPARPREGAPPSPQQDEVIRVETGEVLLDMVVRDRRGKIVRDLRPEEVEVYEDGVRQKVNAFRLVEGEPVTASSSAAAGPVAPTGTPKRVDPLRHINLITLVFDNLNLEARQLANQAATKFLESELRPNDMVAVFVVANRLNVLQHFSNDRKALREAVSRATSGSNTQFQSKSEEIRQQLDSFYRQSEESERQSASANQSQGAGAAGIGASAVEAKTAEITLNALNFSETLQREQQGRSSLYSLLALVKEQGRLQGRKTLIYFSEGLQVPPSLVELLNTTKSEANRANVSIYSVDARGLMTKNVNEMAGEMLAQSARASRSQLTARPGSPVTREQVMSGDKAEESLRGNVQGTLDDLAVSTGGYLIANTNDFRGGMQNIVADLGSYYELAYTPTARKYDGAFRPISVKVAREGVKLQTRNGYFDMPATGGPPILPYEMPLMVALNAARPPRAFDYRAVALHFNQTADGQQYALVIETPLANFTFTPDKAQNVYRAHFSMMALVKDAGGRVVQKLSQDFPLEGALDRMGTVTAGNAILTRTYWLPPGRYSLETAALDRTTSKVSARRSVLVVPPLRPGVKMSSLSVVKRVEPLAAADAPTNSGPTDDPFRTATTKIIPFVGEPSLKMGETGGGGLPLYLIIYPAKEIAGAPQLALEFLLDGAVVGQAKPELPAPDAQGRIPFVLTIPSANFKPGRYEVRAVVRQGATAAEEHAFFNINP